MEYFCKICGVKMSHDWVNGICVHCDWMLGEGYTEKEIKQIVKKAQKNYLS
jgi:hypothetical protein